MSSQSILSLFCSVALTSNDTIELADKTSLNWVVWFTAQRIEVQPVDLNLLPSVAVDVINREVKLFIFSFQYA